MHHHVFISVFDTDANIALHSFIVHINRLDVRILVATYQLLGCEVDLKDLGGFAQEPKMAWLMVRLPSVSE